MRTIAITGVGGFIGHRLAERALERGLRVRGLDLSPEAAARAEALGVDTVVGDICDAESARRVCEGADAVVHTAAVVREDGPWELFRRVHVAGTETMARAARDAGAQRFVHLSSVMVYGFHYPPDIAEDGPLCGDDNPYCTTKIESEQAVMAFHGHGDLQVVILRPGDVYGPGSIPWVVRPVDLIRKRMMVLPTGPNRCMNPVHIDNLVDATFLALETEHTGEAFNITDGLALPYAEYMGRLARMVGMRLPPRLPLALLRVLFRAAEAAYLAAGKEPLARPQALNYLVRPGAYSIDKARRLLGYAPRIGFEEGMREVEDWLRQEGAA
jgi:nucleoside-diphosphate-sugar epimerase